MLPRWIGRRVDDFVVEDRIGRGGMAMVYRAHQLSVNRYVALKIIDLSSNQAEREEFRQRFQQEAAVIALLEHIHVLPIYAYGIVEDEFAYIAMRLLRGGSLADLLHTGALAPLQAATIFTQVGRGLAYAHSKGVIHRDLKPSNILLDEAGNAYLSDFGLAKMVGTTLDLTRSGNLVGTPTYVAPELVRGDPADHRSDIYSLGVLLYHMVTGRTPFELSDSGIAALLYKHIEEPPPPPHLINPAVTPELEIAILRALDKDPDQRYQSAGKMVEAVNLAVGHKGGIRELITLHPPHLSRLAPRMTKARRRLLLSGALLILLIAILSLAVSPQFANTLPPIQIVASAHGTLDDVTPSEADIAAAQQQLGGDGFIAYLACTYSNVSQMTRAREMSDMLTQLGLAYRVYNAENDTYTQVTQIEQARLDGARAIILCPLGTDVLTNSIKSLAESHIPLTYITLFDNPYGVKEDSSSYDIGLVVGRLGGQIYQDEHSDQPPQVIVLTYPGLPAADQRADGMEAGFQEVFPGVVFGKRYDGFTQESGYNSVKALIQADVHFNVILSMTDAGAYGAIDALQEAGFDPSSVIVVSANGEAYAQELIRDGTFLRGTVAINREQSSQLAVDATIKMLAGAEVPEFLSYPPGDVLTREVLMALGS